jgi:hypothetical protein
MAFEKRTIGDCTLYCGDSLQLLQAGAFDKCAFQRSWCWGTLEW